MNNESAFPTGIITDDKGLIIGGSNGMSLRDYFAAQAMQEFLNFLVKQGWQHEDLETVAGRFDEDKTMA